MRTDRRIASKYIYGFCALTGVSVFALLAASSGAAAVDKKPVVFVKPIHLEELSETLTYPARVEPRIKASVVAENDGVVTKILAPLGHTVKTNAAVLIIRNTDPVYEYSPMRVTSPVAGVVSRVDVTEGSRVSKGDKLLMVTDPEQVRIVVEITARDVSDIKPGLMAELKVPGRDFEDGVKVKVRGMSPFVDPATGTAACELELVKAPQKGERSRLPPMGSIGRVVFSVNKRTGVSIADSSVTYRGKEPFVRVVDAGRAKLVAVKLGRKEAGNVEVLKGLKPGDKLVERAAGFVADGEEVEVKTAGEKSSGEAPAIPAGKS